MKYLKKIDELYKSTYKSAADKLLRKHKKRSEDIMKWAGERGESELKKKDVEREYPHAFSFTNKDLEDLNLLGKFFITDSYCVEENGYIMPATNISINMISEWGLKINLELVIENETYELLRFKIKFNNKYERKFLFNNRKDAIELRRYLIQNVDEEFTKLRINDIYTSD
jgi:hypothetical protein